MKNLTKHLKRILFFYRSVLKDNIFFISLFSFILIVFSFYLPLSYDEVLSWKYFIRKNILYAIFTYPEPNNHIFHSIIQNIFWHLTFFINHPFTLRIIPIIASISTVAALLYQLKSPIYKSILFLVIISQYEFLEFAFQARGYSIGLLCAVLSMSTLHRNLPIKYFVILSVIGLYNNPSYLYTFSILILVLAENTRNFKKITTTGLMIGAVTFCLYLPIIINEGLSAITQNRYVSEIENFSLDTLTDYFLLLIDRFLGGVFTLTVLFILILKFKAIRIKDIFLNISMLIVLVLLMLVLKQTPFPRVFIPVTGVFFYGLTILLNRESIIRIETYLNKIPRLIIIPFVIITSISISFYWDKKIEKEDLSNSYLLKKFVQSSSYSDSIERVYISNHSITQMILVLEGHFYFKNTQVIYTDKTLEEINKNKNFYYITSDLNYRNKQPLYEFNSFNRTTLVLK